MIKSFKGKINAIYFTLIVILILFSIFSVLNIYDLKRAINSTMDNNYSSINLSNNMCIVIEKQNLLISAFINKPDDNISQEFFEKSKEFWIWYNEEQKHISEDGEKEIATNLGSKYVEYVKGFSDLDKLKGEGKDKEALTYYENEMLPIIKEIVNDLQKVTTVNENSMVISQEKISRYADNSIFIILGIGILVSGISLILSRKYVDKTLKPIMILTETIKKVRKGEINQEVAVVSKDEIGIMAMEFNNMTRRLHQYEKSTLGQLIEERDKNSAIIQGSTTPLIMIDEEFKIKLFNDAFKQMFHIDHSEIMDKHITEIMDQEKLFIYIDQAYKELLDGRDQIERIMRFQIENEEYFYNIIITPIKNIDCLKNIKDLIIVFQDVTGLKQIERIKGQFVSNVSHEFKTPLTSMMMATSLLKDKNVGVLNEKQNKIILALEEDLNILCNLVNDLIKLAKLEGDKGYINMEKMDLAKVIMCSIEEYKDLAENKNISLNYKIEKNIPSIYGDSNKLKWVINNLLSNAIKFTNSNGHIYIRAYNTDSKVYVSVKDNGIGIPDQYIDKIFDRFMQAPNRNKVEGTGLGLAIAKEIIDIHHGQIWCESIETEGSEFTISLPIDRSDNNV